jgi:hypothetical protein
MWFKSNIFLGSLYLYVKDTNKIKFDEILIENKDVQREFRFKLWSFM